VTLPPSSNPDADFAQVQLGPGRAGRAERDAHELDAGQGLVGAHGHQLDGIGAHGWVAFVFKDFHAVDHRAQRPDKVVADAADHQRGKFDVIHGELNAAPMVSNLLTRQILLRNS
jgi:hypothetical protein